MSIFVVITGLPASGKSTLGAQLAAVMGLPLLDKDTFLEQLFDLDGDSPRYELSRRADESFRSAAVKAAGGAVLVSWWRHPQSSLCSGTPIDWLMTLPGNIVEIHCTCSPTVALQRFRSRIRHFRHEDERRPAKTLLAQLKAQFLLGSLGVLPLIEVNTEAYFDVPAILSKIEAAIGQTRCV